jgi:hypothetical protein
LTDYPETVPQSDELTVLFCNLPEMPLDMAAEVLKTVIRVCGSEYLKMELRNKQMLGEFNGHNVQQLCRRYRLKPCTFYRILRTEQKRLRLIVSKRLKRIT